MIPKHADIVEHLVPQIEQVLFDIDSDMELDEAKAALRWYLDSVADKLHDPRMPRVKIPWGVFKFSPGKLNLVKTGRHKNKKRKINEETKRIETSFEDWIGPISQREEKLDQNEGQPGWFNLSTFETYASKLRNYLQAKADHQRKLLK